MRLQPLIRLPMRMMSIKGPEDETIDYSELKVEGAKSRSDIVKNLSLTLLSAQTPMDVLDIFTKEIH